MYEAYSCAHALHNTYNAPSDVIVVSFINTFEHEPSTSLHCVGAGNLKSRWQ